MIKMLKTFIEVRWLRKFRNRELLEQYQNKQLQKHLKFIKKHSEYFRNIDTKSFNTLPYMNKELMMDNFDRINTAGIKKDEAFKFAINSEKSRKFDKKLNGISVGLSSGTSGHRGLFIVNDDEIATWVGGIFAKILPKNKLFNNKIAFFLRADSNLYEGINNTTTKFKYFDILKDFDDNVKELNDYNPTILVAPPSVLILLSKYKMDCSLNIRPIKIISVAEVLSSEDEKRLCQAFNVDMIYQVYQCTEGFLGYTCECGSLHLNEDGVYFEKEYIDDKRFIPIITDFMRTSQPIIRYRLNDILIESDKKCKCGSPLMVIEKIEGRMDDVFIFNNEEGKEVNVFPDFISRCILYVDGIKEYKVLQKSKDEIIIYINKINEQIKYQIISEFNKLSKKMCFVIPKISFMKFNIDLSKKMKRVERGF